MNKFRFTQQGNTPKNSEKYHSPIPGTSAFPVTPSLPSQSDYEDPNTPVRSQSKRPLSAVFSEPPHKRKIRQSPREKLAAVLDFITDDLNWTFSEFLYEFFRNENDKGEKIERDLAHRVMIARFLGGRTKHALADILHEIMQDPCSQVKRSSKEWEDMYSRTTSFLHIKPAYPALTTLAVELVLAELLREISTVVQSANGLHGSMDGDRRGARKQLCWEDISPTTVEKVKNIFEMHQPLGHHIILQLATPKPKTEGGITRPLRKSRPPALATVEILSDIAHCRTPYARLLPVARGILYFACGAQQSLFAYNSRVGHTPSWNTTVATLKRLAEIDGELLKALGRDLTRAAYLRTDNVQKYVKQQAQRLGRGNYMKIGLAALAAEAVDYDPMAADLDDKLKRIAESKRADLTVEQLLAMVDTGHYEKVATLQWLQTLVTYIPQLAHYRSEVAELFRTDGAKLRIPANRKTVIHPLATVAKNENVAADLRDAVVDFMQQLGQEDGDFVRRLVFMGGDGLTYERLLQLKRNLRFQDNSFRRMDILQPFLETWHAQWTYLSLTYELHWEGLLTKDPSKIGHNAAKIDQKGPTNVSKVDYYPAAYLSYLVLDVRMLDCWRIALEADDIFAHFETLAVNGNLPTLEALRKHAARLYHQYSSHHAYETALTGQPPQALEDLRIPTGSPWTPPEINNSSVKANEGSDQANKRRKKEPQIAGNFEGDQTLAQSIMFMHDTMLSREVASAVAEADVGRVYEGMKRMMFSFAGSSHSKYMSYLLEMICDLELESSPILREVFLRNWLINPSGEAGGMQEGDLVQEHYNRELEAFIDRKDTEWDADYIRKVIAPNVHHFVTLKNTWGEGVGLAKRRGNHPEPHSKPEVKILLQIYKDEELHKFRVGRHYAPLDSSVDSFSNGIKKLNEGKLEQWVRRSLQARATHGPLVEDDNNETHTGEDEMGDLEAEEDELMPQTSITRGRMELVNGALVVDHEGLVDESNDYLQDDSELVLQESGPWDDNEL